MGLLLAHCWMMMEQHTSLREMGLPHRGGPGPALFYPAWREYCIDPRLVSKIINHNTTHFWDLSFHSLAKAQKVGLIASLTSLSLSLSPLVMAAARLSELWSRTDRCRPYLVSTIMIHLVA